MKIQTVVIHDGPQGVQGPAGTNIYVQPGDPGSVPDGTLWLDTDDTTPDTSLNWGDIAGTLSSQTDLNTALAAKAPLASPALTGTPTAPTATPGTNTTQVATTAFVAASTPAIPITTKGDLYGYSTTGARVPVGADGRVLIADSSQTTGLRWISPSRLPPLSSNWMTPESHGLGTTNFTATQPALANQMDLVPIYVPVPLSITKIGIVVDSASAAGNVRLGIYDSGGNLLLDAGTVTTSVTGERIITLGTAFALSPGWVYPALLPDTNFTPRAYAPQQFVGTGNLNFSSAGTSWKRQAVTYGPLPSTAVVVLGNGGNGPRIGMVVQ